MATPTHYLAVLKASYDYEPQSEDEIAVKEDQLLYLIERTDDDWWKVKVKGASEDSEGGLVPSAYLEPAEHKSTVKALYDYEASAPGELSVKEDEVLYAFDAEEEWLLVQTDKDGGKAGFIPVTYIDDSTEGHAVAEEEPEVEAEEEEEEEADHNPIAGIVVPPSPPRPSAPYVDPAERVAASHPASAAANDAIKTWAVSEVDKKGKKKKGTLGIGNGSIFFASESDKTPVQKWPTADVESSYTEKSKHVHIEITGANPINLHFNAGSKDTAEAIIDKLDSSKQIAMSQVADEAAPVEAQPAIASTSSPKPKKNGVSVRFASNPPSIISPRDPDESSEPDDYVSAQNVAQPDDGNERATVLYDFVADGEDELAVGEGDRLIVLERDQDDWWKVRDSEGREGVVPAQYVELDAPAASNASSANGNAAKAAAERERLEGKERQREKEEAERRAEAERKAQAAAAAEAAEAERKHREREREKRAREEAERRAHEQQEAEQKRAAREPRPDSSSGSRRRQSEEAASSSRGSKPRGSSDGARVAPSPQRVRTWRDRTGQFQVDAEFLGMSNGKLRLHKTNGVVIEVPSEKMSAEDLQFAESHSGNGKSRDREREKSRKPTRALSPVTSDDDQPLAERRRSLQPEPKSKPAPPKKSKPVDWFEFFLSAGCDIDDCTRYASSFERDKIDESILPDITQQTMRQLGLREGDIIRVSKHILQKIGGGNSALEEQMRKDEEMALKLQEEENTGGGAPKGQTTSPSLFSGPGGALKNNTRRGRPQPSKSTPPASVDLLAISTASEQINRERSPSIPLVASPTSAVTALPRASSAAAVRGFDDDAWTNRPSSTQPAAPTPPASIARAPSAPPAPAAPPAPQAVPPPPATATPTGSSTGTGLNLARATENDVFDQLARLAAYKPTSPPVAPPSPVTQQMSHLSVRSPTIMSPPPGIQNGLGAGSSPVPVGQLQNQFTGLPQNYGPRGPFAPVPGNQGLLQPLVPTTTGFNSFIPIRPASNPPPSFNSPSPQPSFLNTQPTGFSGPMTAQPTGFSSPFNNPQPTGFQGGGLTAQQTGFPGALAPQPTGFQPSGPLVQQTTSYPGAFGSGPFTGGRAFGALQPNVTGFNPAFGQMSSSPIPPVPSLPSNTNANNNTNPANIFAQMKSGTFGDESAPQQSNKYDALRPQPTGWGATTGYQNGGYSGTFY